MKGALALDLPISPLVIIGLIATFGFVVKSMTGLGFALVFMPLASLLVDPKPLVPVTLVYGLVANALVLVESRRYVNGHSLPVVIVAGLAGVPIGAHLLSLLSVPALKIAIGAIVVVLAIPLVIGRLEPLPETKVGAASAGFVSGIIHTATGMGGPPLALFFSSCGYQKHAFRAAINAVFVPLTAASLVGLASAGLISWQSIQSSLFLMPALGIGYLIGLRLARYTSPRRFQQIAMLLVVVTGCINVFDGLVLISQH